MSLREDATSAPRETPCFKLLACSQYENAKSWYLTGSLGTKRGSCVLEHTGHVRMRSLDLELLMRDQTVPELQRRTSRLCHG